MSPRQLIDTWLFRLGVPEPGEVILTQRRVFILPTNAGLGYGALLVVMFIGSINYNLSLGFALTFLVAACAVIDIHLTFRNLAYLHLSATCVSPVFAGEDAQFALLLTNKRVHARFAIRVGFIGQRAIHTRDGTRPTPLPMQPVDIAAMTHTQLLVPAPSTVRGWLPAPRVRLTTCFPLGLLRAWSYWHPQISALVYPCPETGAPPLPRTGTASTAGLAGHGVQDEFAGIRTYRPGDSVRHLAWRQIARMEADPGSPLMTKQFDGSKTSDLLFDFDALPHNLPLEARLSRLACWILEAERRTIAYGLRLGTTQLGTGLGPAQQHACLRALALYQGP